MPKLDEIGQEREKNILGPITADTRPRQENSKKIAKKFKNFEKTLSIIIFSQNGIR